ncbi:MAG: hypothetical protein LUD51_02615 [Clostridia bacterium]|nr:hypothetical protein [Clostridia bacterium]
MVDWHMTQWRLHRKTGLSMSEISHVLNGQMPVNDYIAKALEKAFPIGAYFWLALQADYDSDMVGYMKHVQAGDREVRSIVYPGMWVQYYMKNKNMTSEDLCERSGLSMAEIQGVLDGRMYITRKIAKGLGQAGFAFAAFWIERQKSYHKEVHMLKRNIQDLKEHGVPFYPAVRLRDYLNEYPYTTAELVVATGLKEETVKDLLDGRQSVTMEIAMAFEKIFDSSRYYWLCLQLDYEDDVRLLRKAMDGQLSGSD